MRTNRIHSRIILVLACGFMQALSVFSQSDSQTPTITNMRMIGIGGSYILDTYLSPEHYSGAEVRFIDHTTRQADGKKWSSQLVHQAYFSATSPRSDDNTDLAGMYMFSFSRHLNWQTMDGKLSLKAGFSAEADLGFLYNTGNGNNPAQLRMALNVGPSAAARYNFQLWKKPLAVRYEASAPLLGITFAPNFGQSYYEIFSRGDYDNNVKLTYPINSPCFRQMLTLEIPVRKTVFTIGYMGDYQQAELNMIKYHNYSHMLLLGLVKRFKIKNIEP